MMRLLQRTVLVGLAVFVSAAGVAAQEQAEWRGAISAGDLLRVQGIVGEIEVVEANGATAQVIATKRGRSGDFDAVHVVFEEDGDGLKACAVYRRTAPDSCEQDNRDDDDRWDDRDIDVSVHFEVRVPRGVEFRGSMVTGDIVVEGLRSDVSANTVTGDIFVSTSGVAEARTVTGRIEVEMASTDFDDLRFNTVSGDITVSLPAGTDADIDFESLTGEFESDFDLTIRSRSDRFIGSEFTGRLGAGGPGLSFQTVSGDVELRRLQTN